MIDRGQLSILIIDDQVEVLEIYNDVLIGLGHKVECVSMPGEALRYLGETLPDIVLIDAKLTYKGASMGGVILAEEVSKKLGINSVILMSQYDVREKVRRFDPAFTFLPKPKDGINLLRWVKQDLMGRVDALLGRQYVFVSMAYDDKKTTEIYKTYLRTWAREIGYDLKRMDEIPTVNPINTEQLERIKNAHFLLLIADVKNANAYFEAGYATAIDKYIVIVTQDIESLPFNVRANRALRIDLDNIDQSKWEFFRLINGLRGVECPED